MRQTHHLDQIRKDEISNLAIEHKLYLRLYLMFCRLEKGRTSCRAGGKGGESENIKDQDLNGYSTVYTH